MRLRRDRSFASSLRLALASMAAGLCLVSGALAQGTLLPPGFFDNAPMPGEGQAAVEADTLAYDAANDIITAGGGVVLNYKGYVIKADRLVFNQKTSALTAEGNVNIRDPKGTIYSANSIDVTGGMKQAFINSLTVVTTDGSLITADQADYSDALVAVLTNGSYSPCGLCIDSKGRKIGWKVRATKITYDRVAGVVELEQPALELLGMQVFWLPWLRLPDPSQPRLTGFRLPQFDYTMGQGLTATVPYFWAIDQDTDVIFSPRLMSRQGGLFAAEIIHRFGNGEADAKITGVYQLDRSAFAGTVGDRDWRGAFQTSGRFAPIANWTTGWSYTAFTDAAFLPDYQLQTNKNLVNEAYATHLSRDYYADIRLQQFNLLGNVSAAAQDQQARALPNIRTNTVTDLEGDWGQLRSELRLLGVQRGTDQAASYAGVPYITGYKENKAHITLEASWQKQWVVPGGLAVTPYLGLRADGAVYDGSSPLLPGGQSLLTATPIAALDVRWPLMASAGDSSFLFEPITQLVYRGSDTTATGITNDNALSFVFDDTNLFSYNRFSGTDLQETGLRANVGAHYLANFADGSWLDLVGGQSYFLAGLNALGVADTAQVGANTGLGANASYFVLGATAGITAQFAARGKVQVDPAASKVTLATLGASYNSLDGFTASAEYTYIAANPAVGTIADQQEISGNVGFPLADYWRGTVSAAWDIAQNSWLEAGGGVTYDDGYLVYGASGLFTGPTHSTPNDFRALLTFKLRSPTGEIGISR